MVFLTYSHIQIKCMTMKQNVNDKLEVSLIILISFYDIDSQFLSNYMAFSCPLNLAFQPLKGWIILSIPTHHTSIVCLDKPRQGQCGQEMPRI